MQPTVLFVTHPQQACGVHQFGRQILEVLATSRRYRFVPAEVATVADLDAARAATRPDAMIVNWHPITFPSVPPAAFRATRLPIVALMHEITDDMVRDLAALPFDRCIDHDPSGCRDNPRFVRSCRPLPVYANRFAPPPLPTIGTFGFAGPTKGLEDLVHRVQEEFDECLIRMALPFNAFGDPDGTKSRALARRCRAILTKPGVRLDVSHEFRTIPRVLDFLARNSLNAFFYVEQQGRGISSAVDLAIAAGRPVAVRRTSMFRHVTAAVPSICVEERSLQDILAAGTAPLAPFRDAWTHDRIRADYETLLDEVLADNTPNPERPAPAPPARRRWWNHLRLTT
jgi:hypothetical protein